VTEEERKSIKNKISAAMGALKEHMAALEFSIQQLPSADTLDGVTRRELINYKRSCEAAIRDTMKKIKLNEVALKRVDSPDFGLCIDCEKEIFMDRLMEIPDTFYCAECDADEE